MVAATTRLTLTLSALSLLATRKGRESRLGAYMEARAGAGSASIGFGVGHPIGFVL